MVELITEQQFDSFLEINEKLLVVDVFAEWCGPCKKLSVVLDSLNTELKEKVKFVKIDADNNPGFMEKFSIQALPTVIVFKDGKEIDKVVGFSPDKLKSIIQKAL
uniref:Thioredoxin n=1 Tax=Henneguya salminicola TaxID=69463 RepID=A0A6G3MJM4_HENSL